MYFKKKDRRLASRCDSKTVLLPTKLCFSFPQDSMGLSHGWKAACDSLNTSAHIDAAGGLHGQRHGCMTVVDPSHMYGRSTFYCETIMETVSSWRNQAPPDWSYPPLPPPYRVHDGGPPTLFRGGDERTAIHGSLLGWMWQRGILVSMVGWMNVIIERFSVG
mmetsp:Transcript_40168/g.83654  ORF Transcript_40168/g.83654 Transcript_40168/m.83654 type:complete len:162 (+) Transcript_40168:151-636(+)